LSGVSISYAIGAILGGAFAPTIAQYLVSQTGWVGTVGIYLMIMALISGIAVFLIREPLGAPLTPHEEEAAAQIPQPHEIQPRPQANILLPCGRRSLLAPLVSKRRRPVSLLSSQSIPPRMTKYSVSSKEDKMSSADKANRGGA